MASKNIGKAAGELSKLFDKRDRNYPQMNLQDEINAVLVDNDIKIRDNNANKRQYTICFGF